MHPLLRSAWLVYALGVTLFMGVFLVGQLVVSSRTLTIGSYVFRGWADSIVVDADRRENVVRRILEKARTYESQIEESHLLLGMLVNRDQDGNAVDVCDSLLFSSLRFVSLVKLGMTEQANQAWAAIEKSQDNGRWFRHPRCKTATSRDMILGVLAALTQWPANHEIHLRRLIAAVSRMNGSLDHGPFYVSYLSPGIAEIVRLLAMRSGFGEEMLPSQVRQGFSTLELDASVMSTGYRSHLVALTTWTELELETRGGGKARSPHLHYGPLGRLFAAKSLRDRRIEWATSRLVEVDSQNIFYRWIRLKAAGALSEGARIKMMEELLSMPQFPEHLPWDCDRRADYVWQRDSSELSASQGPCTFQYSGVDFLWMAGLLVNDPLPFTVSNAVAIKDEDDSPFEVE